MRKYRLTIHTEEMKGRYEKTEVFSCLTEEESRSMLFYHLTKFESIQNIEKVDDDNYIVYHAPRMRSELSVSEM